MENENQYQVKKSNRGGARPGAGRKRTSASSIALRIPEDVAEILAGVDNRSAYIVEAIRAYARRDRDFGND